MTGRRTRGLAAVALAAVALALAVAAGSVTASAPPAAAAPSTASPAATPSDGAAGARNTSGGGTSPHVDAVYPNPVADGDRGEYVALEAPPDTQLGEFRLRDDDGVTRLPNRTASGRVVVLLDGRPAGPLDGTVVNATGSLALSNTGERVRLIQNGTTLDAVTYSRAPESEVFDADSDSPGEPGESDDPADGTWIPRGATDLAPTTATDAEVRAFALPDAPGPPLDTLESADRRLYLGGYTFTSQRAAAALRAAARRGVDVRVLLDGGPVGGITREEARLLDDLAAAGANVSVTDGPHERYRFHHAKYAVVDDRALVTSENWEASGTGGHGSRGWGVVVEDGAFAERLAGVFRTDGSWRGAVPWERFRENQSFRAGGEPATEAFPERFPPVATESADVELVTAPDNAERRVHALLASAEESVLVQQAGIGANHTFLRGAVGAARRGVEVRVLLDGAWYAREENRETARRLNRIAARDGLPLSARLAEPRSRYSHVHVKGVVVDGERTLVGSLNWNDVAVRENREIAVVVDDRAVGAYYRRLFVADWRGGAWRVSAGTLLALAGAVWVTLRQLREQVQFVGRDATGAHHGTDANRPPVRG